jgi:hypothetical protein
MATIRISPTEVRVDDVIYVFKDADDADDFEACTATVSLEYCEKEVRAIDKRQIEASAF